MDKWNIYLHIYCHGKIFALKGRIKMLTMKQTKIFYTLKMLHYHGKMKYSDHGYRTYNDHGYFNDQGYMNCTDQGYIKYTDQGYMNYTD